MIKNIIIIGQITTSILLIASILLQQREGGLGSAFGQEGRLYGTLRGVQKKIFLLSIALAVIFVLLSLANLII